MAVNIVSLVTQFITPQLVARIASALGINPTLAQTLVNAALPSVLAAIGGVAATPAGAANISGAISNQDPDMLGSLMKEIGGANHGAIVDAGQGMLGGLIGNTALGGLAGAIGKFAGADANAAKSVLGLVAPAVMGTLGQQDPDVWSDANGIGKFFDSQKNSIASAMPANLGSALSSTGLLQGFESLMQGGAGAAATAATAAAATAAGAMRSAGSAATGAARSTTTAASNVAASAASGGIPGWLIGVIAAAILALIIWYFMGGKTPEKVVTAAQTTSAQITSGTAITAANIGEQFTATYNGLKTTLTGITSVDSAKAALPKLAEATGQLDKISAVAATLPAEVKTGFKASMGALVKPLLEQLDKILAIPGVGDVAKPAIEALRAKLTALAA